MKRREEKIRSINTKIIKVFLVVFFLFVFWEVLKIKKNSIWDGQQQINLLIEGKSIILVTYRSKENNLVILQIPEDLYVEFPYSFGNYPLKGIFGFEKILKKEDQKITFNSLIKKTLANNFYLTIDGFLYGDPFLKLTKDNDDLKKNLQNDFNLVRLISLFRKINQHQIKTNLSYFDLGRFFLAVRNVRADKIKFYDLSKSSVIYPFKLKDKTRVKIIDNEKIVPFMSELFTDEQIKDENLNISISNASQEKGKAKRTANLITVLGAVVIQTTTNEKKEIKSFCQIKSKKIIESYTYRKIQKITSCQLKNEPLEGLSDINIIIGSDY